MNASFIPLGVSNDAFIALPIGHTGAMRVRAADLRDRHPIGYSVVVGVLSGLLFGGYVGLLERSFGLGVFGGCFFATFMTLVNYLMIRRQGRLFPPGLDRESRAAVEHIVRTGAAVEDPALAPAVAFHAGAILRIPYTPVFSIAALVLFGLSAVGFLIAAIQDSDVGPAWAMGMILFAAVAQLLILVSTARRRRRAAAAYEGAQRLMAMQG